MANLDIVAVRGAVRRHPTAEQQDATCVPAMIANGARGREFVWEHGRSKSGRTGNGCTSTACPSCYCILQVPAKFFRLVLYPWHAPNYEFGFAWDVFQKLQNCVQSTCSRQHLFPWSSSLLKHRLYVHVRIVFPTWRKCIRERWRRSRTIGGVNPLTLPINQWQRFKSCYQFH